MQNPKLSVIMTVRNSEDTLAKTMDSILGQTFKDFEFIIVNDASEDKTGDLLKQYGERDSRVKVITNAKWLERCMSRNLAIDQSEGEYIAVTDADDISFPTRFAKQVVYLDQHSDCYLVGARAEIVDKQGRKIGESFGLGYDADISELLVEENRLVHSSVMYRNSKEIRYREKFKYAQDYDLFLQILQADKKIHLLDEILVQFSEKKDLVFNEYKVQQAYFAELAKYLYKEEKENMKDRYDEVDVGNLEQYVPEQVILEMNMKKAFFTEKDFGKAREYVKKLIDIDPSVEWRIYYLDTFFRGWLRKVAKPLKRRLKYRK